MATPSFEKDLEKLETIVAALEEGSLSLDDSLKRFEEGTRLYKRCQKALTEAEKRIEILTKNSEGDLEVEPFEEECAEVMDEEKPAVKPSPANRPAPTPQSKTRKPPETDPDIDDDDDDDGDLLF